MLFHVRVLPALWFVLERDSGPDDKAYGCSFYSHSCYVGKMCFCVILDCGSCFRFSSSSLSNIRCSSAYSSGQDGVLSQLSACTSVVLATSSKTAVLLVLVHVCFCSCFGTSPILTRIEAAITRPRKALNLHPKGLKNEAPNPLQLFKPETLKGAPAQRSWPGKEGGPHGHRPLQSAYGLVSVNALEIKGLEFRVSGLLEWAIWKLNPLYPKL